MADRPRQLLERPKGSSAEGNPALAAVVERNIATLIERRKSEESSMGWQARLADTATRFTGSMAFLYFHLVCFSFWFGINLGLFPSIPPWDPSFSILGTVAAVEVIFLSTFILISQNRKADVDRKHADLDLQVSLLAEHEVTKIVTLVTAIADHLGIEPKVDREELEELKQDVAPETVLDKLNDLSE